MNSAKQYMNSSKQCMNSEPMWGYCSRAEKKKKKKAENADVRKRAIQTVPKSLTNFDKGLTNTSLFKKAYSINF